MLPNSIAFSFSFFPFWFCALHWKTTTFTLMFRKLNENLFAKHAPLDIDMGKNKPASENPETDRSVVMVFFV